jgi:hypothetical protein
MITKFSKIEMKKLVLLGFALALATVAVTSADAIVYLDYWLTLPDCVADEYWACAV